MFLKYSLIILVLHWAGFSSSNEDIIAAKLGRSPEELKILSLDEQLKIRQDLLTRSKDSLSLKSEAMKASAKEFSGALQWFHRAHVLGDKVRILVFENSTIDHPCLRCERLSQIEPPDKHQLDPKSDKNLDHATIVVSVLQSMTPHAFISILSPLTVPLNNSSFVKTIGESQIINQSLGFTHWKESLPYIEKLKIILSMGDPKLVIQSAGNSDQSLSDSYNPHVKEKKGTYSDWERFSDHRVINEYLQVPELQISMIVVGAIDQNYEKSSFSNYPGEKESIQNNFLCVLGRDVGAMRYNTFQHVKGTSVAAPIVSGAAALLMSAYPSLNSINIKEVLLESADQTFFITESLNSDDPKKITLVYDPQDTIPDVSSLQSKGYRVELRPFDPKIYGKGVLNLRNAREYAMLKQAHPATPSRELRARMKEKLQRTEEDAAQKIQSAFRAKRPKVKKYRA